VKSEAALVAKEESQEEVDDPLLLGAVPDTKLTYMISSPLMLQYLQESFELDGAAGKQA